MTAITIPPPQTKPLTLGDGDTLTVTSGGQSHDVTINDGGVETVNTGGSSLRTTINEGGMEFVNNGSIVDTTINGGGLRISHSMATNTTLNAYGSQEEGHDGSTFTNTIIENGSLLLDATSSAVNVTFRPTHFPFHKAGLALGNPQNFSGVISGLAVGDILQFGDATGNPPIHVTGFHVANNILTIDYNPKLHASYHLANMQANTTFKLVDGHDTSTLEVVRGIGAVVGLPLDVSKASDIVGIAAHHDSLV